MKTKLCRPILIETKNDSRLFTMNGVLKYTFNGGFLCYHPPKWLMFNLHIISLDPNEKIEEGDWYIDDCDKVRQAVTSDKDYWNARPDYHKIIASTDKSLDLPQPSLEYIQQFIEEYNTDDIKDVRVEMKSEDFCTWESNNMYASRYVIKVNENNLITVHPVEPIVYNEEEVKDLMLKFNKEFNLMVGYKFLKWFEQNKKQNKLN